MAKAGYTQGDMSPKVEGYQKPASSYSQEGFSKTTDYIARNNATVGKQGGEIRKQAYKGRYA